MLLHRYNNIEFVLQTDIDIGAPLILRALDQDKEERLFQQWVAQLPVMAISGNAIGFREYKDRVTGANIDRRPTAEIMDELDKVEQQLREEAIMDGA